MRQYKKYLKIMGFVTGLMLAAMIATNAHSEEFCTSYLNWFEPDGTPFVKEVITPCDIGDAGKDWTIPLGWANECVVGTAAVNIDTGDMLHQLFFHVVDKSEAMKSTLTGVINGDKFYIHRNGENKNPDIVTEKELIDFFKELCEKQST